VSARQVLAPDGVAIRYEIRRAQRRWGAAVLLHGMASNRTRWSEFVEHTALARHWDLIRPDLRGHGDSMTFGPIGMELWIADLAALLDAERCQRAVLIGHSLGAHLALHFAARLPQRTRALALIDPVFPRALRGRRRWLARLRPLLALAAAAGRGLHALGLGRRRYPPRDLRALDERARAELLASGASAEFVRRYSSITADLAYFPLSHYLQELHEMLRPLPDLAAIPAPILVLLSQGLTYTDPVLTARLLESAANVESIAIEAYHWPLTERPAQVRGAIEAWMARRVAPGAD
jgi:pimeloyl-ACP methyl ester carboxylesterase